MKRTLLLTILLSAACADAIDPGQNPGTNPGQNPNPKPTSLVTTTMQGSFAVSSVDARDDTEWVFASLRQGGLEVAVDMPANDLSWDLGFRRSNIRLNGGQSGSGNGAVVPVRGTTLDALTQAPSAGWQTDEMEIEMGPDGSPVATDGVDFAFTRSYGDDLPSGWFSYNPATHVLTPTEVLWAIRTPENKYFALQIIDWYDQAGDSAVWTINWKALEAPAGPAGVRVDASMRGVPVYYDLARGDVTTGGSQSMDWDLAFSRTTITTNGGASGPGFGGARLAPMGQNYDSASDSPTSGFQVDEELPIPGPPGSGTAPGNPALAEWFDYNPTTHAVTPKNTWFLVRSAAGEYYKLRIHDWSDGVFIIESAPLTRAPDIVRLEVDASSRTEPTFVSARLGAVVTASAAETTWDLAITRVVMQTNSGVSGPGQGGAALHTETSLDEVDLPPSVFQVDEMIMSARPGVEPYPGSAVLDDWFDYDPMTRAVTPKVRLHALRTSDGGFAAFVIEDYTDGRYVIQLVYAGAGQTRFK